MSCTTRMRTKILLLALAVNCLCAKAQVFVVRQAHQPSAVSGQLVAIRWMWSINIDKLEVVIPISYSNSSYNHNLTVAAFFVPIVRWQM